MLVDRLIGFGFRQLVRGYGPSPAPDATPPIRDLPFGPDPAQQLDIYRPDAADPAPMLLFLHGGGWHLSDKSRYAPLGHAFAARGVLTLVANYRLAPRHPHPAAARDVAAAVAWAMRHGPDLGGDARQLIVCGQSAGAHLGALIASDPGYLAAHGLSPDALAGFVGLSGLYDLRLPLFGWPTERRRVLVPAFGVDPTGWRDASPVVQATVAGPPCLLAVARFDPAAIHRQTHGFAARLLDLGRPPTLVTVPGRTHATALASLGSAFDPTTRAILRLIDATGNAEGARPEITVGRPRHSPSALS